MLTWALGREKMTLTGRRGVTYWCSSRIHHMPAIFREYVSTEIVGWQAYWTTDLSPYLSDSEKERGKNCEHV